MFVAQSAVMWRNELLLPTLLLRNKTDLGNGVI